MMNPNDALVKGEQLGGQFSYHVIDCTAEPLVHVTRNRRAEVVLFGRDQRLNTPLAINAGNHIMITSNDAGQISVSRFSGDQPDIKRTVSTRLDDVIRAIVSVGGAYPDVVQALEEAKTSGALASRFEVEAVPEAGRTYLREETVPDDDTDKKKKPVIEGEVDKDEADAVKVDDKKAPGFFDRMMGKTE